MGTANASTYGMAYRVRKEHFDVSHVLFTGVRQLNVDCWAK